MASFDRSGQSVAKLRVLPMCVRDGRWQTATWRVVSAAECDLSGQRVGSVLCEEGEQ